MSDRPGPNGGDDKAPREAEPADVADEYDGDHVDMTEEMANDSDSGQSAAEFFVTRDESGEVNAVTASAGTYGEVRVRPMTYGHAERYFGDAGGVANAGAGTVAEIIRNHIEEPDFEAFAEREYGKRQSDKYALNERVVAEEMEPFAPTQLLMAVFKASGLSPDIDMNAEGEANIDFEAGMESGGN